VAGVIDRPSDAAAEGQRSGGSIVTMVRVR
jgi:hypothetical protein